MTIALSDLTISFSFTSVRVAGKAQNPTRAQRAQTRHAHAQQPKDVAVLA